jgi:hypothetical protein
MPDFNRISAALSSADKATIKANIDAIKAITAFFLNLTPKDRQKLFKMGNKSEGFVQSTLAAMKNNPAAVPSTFNVSEFEKDYQLYRDLVVMWMELSPLMEGLEDTMLFLGSELMLQARFGYKFIRQGARGNMALDTVAGEIGARFKRSGRKSPVGYSLNPKEQMTLTGVVPKRLFKTLSTASVTLYRGEVVSGKGKIVQPSSKFFIPSGWTTITVVNNDATKVAMFSLMQK